MRRIGFIAWGIASFVVAAITQSFAGNGQTPPSSQDSDSNNISQPGQINLSDGWVTAQADLCNSRTVTSPTTVTTSHDGSPYQVWTDFRRGKESINSAACGRQYWLKKDPSHYNNGIKFVYLVDGRGVCIVPFLYKENSDGSLESLRSAPECNSGQVATRNSPDRTPRSQPSNPPQPRQPVTARNGGSLERQEMSLYNLVNQYRAQYGLPPIPLSRSLSYVAQSHVRDLYNFNPDNCGGLHCAHGWSNCAYDANNRETLPCMWEAPRRLGTPYPGNGYEILSGSSSGTISPELALGFWQSSSAHNAVILNQGMWRESWNAMGVGIYRGYAAVWFGREPDPAR
ncbi:MULTISPECIES: CAP domain-containing protein [unclassified Microcoleus]|uniref:CAP domain-containing protein n=1 Tax=unclassified Microcoleus TaxID=2642155 RepID=UPI002FD67609